MKIEKVSYSRTVNFGWGFRKTFSDFEIVDDEEKAEKAFENIIRNVDIMVMNEENLIKDGQ